MVSTDMEKGSKDMFIKYTDRFIDKAPLFEAIERRNVSEIVNFFDKIEAITLEEARELITDFYDHYISQFGLLFLINGIVLNGVQDEPMSRCCWPGPLAIFCM